MRDKTVRQDASLGEAAIMLSQSKLRTVFITDDALTLLGVFTEGDLARAFVRGAHPDFANVLEFTNKTPFSIHQNSVEQTNFPELFVATGHLAFPVVNDQGKLVDIIDLKSVISAELDSE